MALGPLRRAGRGRPGPVPTRHLGEGDTVGEDGGSYRASHGHGLPPWSQPAPGTTTPAAPEPSTSPRDKTSGRSARGW